MKKITPKHILPKVDPYINKRYEDFEKRIVELFKKEAIQNYPKISYKRIKKRENKLKKKQDKLLRFFNNKNNAKYIDKDGYVYDKKCKRWKDPIDGKFINRKWWDNGIGRPITTPIFYIECLREMCSIRSENFIKDRKKLTQKMIDEIDANIRNKYNEQKQNTSS